MNSSSPPKLAVYTEHSQDQKSVDIPTFSTSKVSSPKLMGLPLDPIVKPNGYFDEPPIMKSVDVHSFSQDVDPKPLQQQSKLSYSIMGEDICGMSLLPPSLQKQSIIPRSSNKTSVPKFGAIESNPTTAYLSTWNLPEGSIKTVPIQYPLERSSIFVLNSHPSEVAARISDCIRSRSITATYHATKAKAKCRTAEGVEFRVRLFIGKGKFAHGIIVEVQKISGFSVIFHQDCCAILDSAQSFESDVVSFSSCTPPIASIQPDIDRDEEQSNFGKDGLMLVDKMLRQDSVGAKILGMQHLCMLTDSSQMGAKAALRNSLNVLYSYDKSRICDVVTSLVQYGEFRGQEEFQGVEAKYFVRLRDLAFLVCMNAVDAMPNNDVLADVLRRNSWVANHLVESLFYELKKAHAKPHEASLAAKCLQRILAVSVEARTKAFRLNLKRALDDAIEFGQSSHAKLEQEASQCALSLGFINEK